MMHKMIALSHNPYKYQLVVEEYTRRTYHIPENDEATNERLKYLQSVVLDGRRLL